MPLEEPWWWYGTHRSAFWIARALRPLGIAYGAIAERRLARTVPYASRLPVICVGNFTSGGTGKTPLAAMIAERLLGLGERPAFLTRGYRGRMTGPVRVDPQIHFAHDVGDEPLLLARIAPCTLARDRKAGALHIEAADPPFSVIIMDDGLQNPALAKDLTIGVVDMARGIGNGQIIPAGPLRAGLDLQLNLADCIVANGQPAGATRAFFEKLRRDFPGPVLSAAVGAHGDAAWLQGTRVVAYAGIGHPQRFFDTLGKLGASVVQTVGFPDHHQFTSKDAKRLLQAADDAQAQLVTTEKDFVRLTGQTGVSGKLAAASRTLPIRIQFEAQDSERLQGLLEAALKTARKRAGT